MCLSRNDHSSPTPLNFQTTKGVEGLDSDGNKLSFVTRFQLLLPCFIYHWDFEMFIKELSSLSIMKNIRPCVMPSMFMSCPSSNSTEGQMGGFAASAASVQPSRNSRIAHIRLRFQLPAPKMLEQRCSMNCSSDEESMN